MQNSECDEKLNKYNYLLAMKRTPSVNAFATVEGTAKVYGCNAIILEDSTYRS